MDQILLILLAIVGILSACINVYFGMRGSETKRPLRLFSAVTIFVLSTFYVTSTLRLIGRNLIIMPRWILYLVAFAIVLIPALDAIVDGFGKPPILIDQSEIDDRLDQEEERIRDFINNVG